MMEIILKSAKTKSDIVTLDQKESGLRGLLNFGHTIGHAIEAILTPHILHGECVSIGIVKEAEISNFLGHLTGSCVGRLITCLKTFNLPVSLEDSLITRHTKKHCSVDSMLNFMKIDKKNQGDKKKIVLLTDIGKTLEQQASIVDDSIIRKILSPNVQVYPLIPKSKISLAVPGSKSISNRALLMAALGSGSCRLHGLLHSDDVQVMLIALEKLLEIKYEWDNETLIINGGNGNLVGQVSSEIYLGILY